MQILKKNQPNAKPNMPTEILYFISSNLQSQLLKIFIKKQLAPSQILWTTDSVTFLIPLFSNIFFRSLIFICDLDWKKASNVRVFWNDSYHNLLMIYFRLHHVKLKIFYLNGTLLKPTCYLLLRIILKPLILIFGKLFSWMRMF